MIIATNKRLNMDTVAWDVDHKTKFLSKVRVKDYGLLSFDRFLLNFM